MRKHLFIVLTASVVGMQGAFAQEYQPDANTVALWHLNETSGSSVADASGNGNNGTAAGTTIVDRRFGKARSFNGTGDFIGIPDNEAGNFTHPPTR